MSCGCAYQQCSYSAAELGGLQSAVLLIQLQSCAWCGSCAFSFMQVTLLFTCSANKRSFATLPNFVNAAESMRAFISLNQSLSGFDAVRAISAKSGVAAIVKKNDVSVCSIALDSLARVVLDFVGRRRPPIEAGHIPHHGFESELARSREHRRTPCSIRGAKKLRHNSGSVRNSLRAVGQLAYNAAARLQ